MIEANILIDNLNRLGVHFLVGDGHSGLADILEPAALLSGLASQSDSRIRLALIAVLLQHPDFANDTHKTLDLLD